MRKKQLVRGVKKSESQFVRNKNIDIVTQFKRQILKVFPFTISTFQMDFVSVSPFFTAAHMHANSLFFVFFTYQTISDSRRSKGFTEILNRNSISFDYYNPINYSVE